MSHVLILGGAGFIGSNLAKGLLREGYRITIADRIIPSEELSKEFDSVKYSIGEFSDLNFIKNLFRQEQVDCVIHLISSLIPSSDYRAFINDLSIQNGSGMELIRIMQENGCNKIVFFSTGGAIYGKNGNRPNLESDAPSPINYYGYSKLIYEEFLKLSSRLNNLQYLILRPSNPYGKGQNPMGKQGLISVSLGRLINNLPIEIWGDGTVVRDYIHINDLTDALIRLLQKNCWNEIFNIGSGEGKTVNELMAIIKNATGFDFHPQYKPSRSIDVPMNILDISKLKKETGWSPRISIKDGIKLYWDDLKNQTNIR